jgi:hypothetical protein
MGRYFHPVIVLYFPLLPWYMVKEVITTITTKAAA